MVNLRKPLAIGTQVTLANSKGERHEWVVIGHERKAGHYTGHLRVEYQGWLSATANEDDVIGEQSMQKSITLVMRDGKGNLSVRMIEDPSVLTEHDSAHEYAAEWIAEMRGTTVDRIMEIGLEWIESFVERAYDGGWKAMVGNYRIHYSI